MRIRTMVAGSLATLAGLALAVAPAAASTGHSVSTRNASPAATGGNLSYHGGPIVTSPKVYIVYYGSQWGTTSVTNDPAGEAALQKNFFSHAYGSGDTFFTSQKQYCQGVASGTKQCGTSGTHVGHPATNPLMGEWLDSSVASPHAPSNSQLAAEARKAATHFGVSGTNVQIIVDTAHGIIPPGFETQFCAWHDQTSGLPYTLMPYVSDAGSGCGANFVATSNGVKGSTEGVTIVGGHEYAETLTDPQAGNGWLDSAGAETGDKCAWIQSGQGASKIIALNGAYFAVQSLWSNNYHSGAGNCVTYYVSATNQH